MTKFSVFIPARYHSTRLPGKPLLDIAGKPMIYHVWQRAIASGADSVFIVTDDQRIHDVAKGFSAKVLLTSTAHLSGSSRIIEAVTALNVAAKEIVVNVQGDEPLIPPQVIRQVAENLAAAKDCAMATLAHPLSCLEEVHSPHVVKVVFDCRGRALYFSRSAIPWRKNAEPEHYYRHIGIYSYRVSCLRQWKNFPPSQLQHLEDLEQLTPLWQGVPIHVGLIKQSLPPGVDTQQDLASVRKHFDLACQS